MNKKQLLASLAVGTVGAAGTIAYASTATTTALGSTAVAGAISTKAIVVNGAPAVLSVVKASMLTKVIICATGIAVTGLAIRYVLRRIDDNAKQFH